MNNKLLLNTVQNYINVNINTDINKLILKGSPFKEVTPQELANQIEAKLKSKKKLPTWFNTENILYPPKLSIEQTSSEKTAEYKSKLFKGENGIDLTGGFGIDAFYFSKQFSNFTHCEFNIDLSETVEHNYKQLKVKNTNFISGDGLAFLKTTNTNFDLIYLDPARRSDVKGKVFLLADTTPNPVENIDLLFSKTNNILIKVSPLLDLKNTIKELKYVKNIHIVSLNKEVKEILFYLENNYQGEVLIITADLFDNKKNITNRFSIYDNEYSAKYSAPKKYLYEPSATILKAGAFNQVSANLNIFKLAVNTHLYTSDFLVPEFTGRKFKIISVVNANKKELKKVLSSDKANITVRNFTMSVDDIRKKFKLKEGGNTYLFFTSDNRNNKLILICEIAE